MRRGIFVAPFDELSDPRVLADLAARAEAAGWDGVFVWDHMLYTDPVRALADAWISLAAVACATERVTIGPLVTPPARRRPQKLAREAVTLDHLSGGRLVLGLGLGGDRGGELSGFGEELDPRARGALLDESLELITALWSGEPVHHRGPAYVADGVTMLPRPVQRPRIPIWLGSRWPNRKPVRRAAHWDGLFPVGLDEPAQLAELVGTVHAERPADAGPFDVIVTGGADDDRDGWAAAGATWWLRGFGPTPSREAVERAIDQG